jgi:hypothetical protein
LVLERAGVLYTARSMDPSFIGNPGTEAADAGDTGASSSGVAAPDSIPIGTDHELDSLESVSGSAAGSF